MPTDFETAYETITTRFGTEFDIGCTDAVGAPIEVRYDGVEESEVPEASFARFVMDPVDEDQATLRNGEYGSRYEHNGLIIVQLLIDRQAVDVAETARKVAVVARNIFRGQTFDGCIIFRNVRINRLDPENRFWRYNVIAEYQFDEIA
jgi:hypothetical protein